MKFSLKTIAAALALAAAAGSASAAIDNGTGGNGELFFSAWDGATSYTFDMNLSINAYETDLAAAGKQNLVWGADFTSSYGSWLASANKSTLQWSVLANDNSGQRRILATVDGALLTTNKNNDVLRSLSGDMGSYLGNVNGVISGNSLITPAVTANTYSGLIDAKFAAKFNFDTNGSFANNGYANGLGFEKTLASATGIAAGTNNAYTDEGLAVRSWIETTANGEQFLHIGVVPEPSEYALLLAGLGLMGAVARRRKNDRA